MPEPRGYSVDQQRRFSLVRAVWSLVRSISVRVEGIDHLLAIILALGFLPLVRLGLSLAPFIGQYLPDPVVGVGNGSKYESEPGIMSVSVVEGRGSRDGYDEQTQEGSQESVQPKDELNSYRRVETYLSPTRGSTGGSVTLNLVTSSFFP